MTAFQSSFPILVSLFNYKEHWKNLWMKYVRQNFVTRMYTVIRINLTGISRNAVLKYTCMDIQTSWIVHFER